jgi:WXG100 family type VII secretion target
VTRIRFDLDELARAEQAARDAVERINDRLTNLRVGLAPLHERWSGEAAQAWATHQREWDDAAADLRAGLAELHRLLGIARANYASTIAANVRMWRG